MRRTCVAAADGRGGPAGGGHEWIVLSPEAVMAADVVPPRAEPHAPLLASCASSDDVRAVLERILGIPAH